MEQPIGQLHDVVFSECGDFRSAVSLRIVKSEPDDPLTARAGNKFERLHDIGGLPMLNTGVQVFFVLSNHDQIHIRVFGLDERVVRDSRSDVGVKP